MQYSQSSCSELFICTAILCWNYQNLKYSFFNITKCTPKLIDFKINIHLISLNNHYHYLKNQEKYFINGFICSNCTRKNFFEYNLNTLNQCYQQITKIKFINYCQYLFSDKQNENFCQCFPSNQSIQTIQNWIKILIKPGKSHRNIIRVNHINKSSSSFVYILIGFILLLVVFGGIIGMIFYWIKFKLCERQRTVK
jgi:hypothetical protein